jgi:hypothetical protein
VAPFTSCVNRRFGGTYRLHLQGRKIRERGTSVSRWLQTDHRAGCFRLVAKSAAICRRWFLARRFSYPEDGGDTFPRNVGSHKMYTAPHSRRQHSSSIKLSALLYGRRICYDVLIEGHAVSMLRNRLEDSIMYTSRCVFLQW